MSWRPAAGHPLRGVFLATTIALLAPAPGRAVVIASGDGSGNTAAAPGSAGWDHVGVRNGASAIYLGGGWVLTAAHLGIGHTLEIRGEVYSAVPASKVQLLNDDGSPTDLMLYRIAGNPDLPDLRVLPIRSSPPPIGTEVIMIGYGRDRGAATACKSHDGWAWGAGKTKRWGTNRIETASLVVVRHADNLISRSFATRFDDNLPTPHEAQAANGDSGGAVFVRNGDVHELAGVIWAVQGDCSEAAAIYGNTTYIVDLSVYRDQILAITAGPGGTAGSPPGGVGTDRAEARD